jgi:hypothetical protein
VKPWTVEWSDFSNADVHRIHWRIASNICAGVITLAATGKGPLEILRRDDLTLLRLHCPGGNADLRVHPKSRTIRVLRIRSKHESLPQKR